MKWGFIYRGLKARYRDERAELKALTSVLRRDEIAVDVGANKGSYLWSLSRAVPDGKVVAFEPQPALAEYLRRACQAAGLANVVVESLGVSDRSGTATLAIPGSRSVSPGASLESTVRDRETCQTVEVPTVSLDEYFADTPTRIGAIKIDVEGHELTVLRGARQVLAKHAPLVVCECEARHMSNGDVGTVLEFFREQGYDGQFVCGSQMLPVDTFDRAVHQRQQGERFWDAPGYCNNFIMQRAR